jgi:hypothetical protein
MRMAVHSSWMQHAAYDGFMLFVYFKLLFISTYIYLYLLISIYIYLYLFISIYSSITISIYVMMMDWNVVMFMAYLKNTIYVMVISDCYLRKYVMVI